MLSRRLAGFTLVETMVTLAIAGMLSLIALPSFQGHLQRTRRLDAIAAIVQVELAEARWRANNERYGSLAEIGVASTSSAGHYALRVSGNAADGYTVVATASGAQAGDRPCRVLTLTVSGADVVRTSGADAGSPNDAAGNRRCWGL